MVTFVMYGSDLGLNCIFFCVIKVFNRLCTQTFYNMLNLLASVDSGLELGSKVKDHIWKIFKYGLFSRCFFVVVYLKILFPTTIDSLIIFFVCLLDKRAHSNIYIEFLKNLPNSFSPNSNYQVAVLFHTIQSEANKNVNFNQKLW
jgi:hypothetical protein